MKKLFALAVLAFAPVWGSAQQTTGSTNSAASTEPTVSSQSGSHRSAGHSRHHRHRKAQHHRHHHTRTTPQ